MSNSTRTLTLRAETVRELTATEMHGAGAGDSTSSDWRVAYTQPGGAVCDFYDAETRAINDAISRQLCLATAN